MLCLMRRKVLPPKGLTQLGLWKFPGGVHSLGEEVLGAPILFALEGMAESARAWWQLHQ